MSFRQHSPVSFSRIGSSRKRTSSNGAAGALDTCDDDAGSGRTRTFAGCGSQCTNLKPCNRGPEEERKRGREEERERGGKKERKRGREGERVRGEEGERGRGGEGERARSVWLSEQGVYGSVSKHVRMRRADGY